MQFKTSNFVGQHQYFVTFLQLDWKFDWDADLNWFPLLKQVS